jgi:chitosanase
MNPATTPAYIRTYTTFLNLAENDSGSPNTDYRSVYIYADGNNSRKQVTLARGFTQDGGNLWKVLQRYIQKGGDRSQFFAAYKSKMGSAVLYKDSAFIKALRDSSIEQKMKDAQDEVFNEVYLSPALSWAENNGFKLPLSYAVAVDSYLHSGKMSDRVTKRMSQKTPSKGGDEKAWITEYLKIRLSWFAGASGALKTCTFRPKFFLGEIDKGNWNMSCPLSVTGKGKIC